MHMLTIQTPCNTHLQAINVYVDKEDELSQEIRCNDVSMRLL